MSAAARRGVADYPRPTGTAAPESGTAALSRRDPAPAPRTRAARSAPLVAAVFVLSGFAALIYQVAWQRALLSVYGVNAESVTVVVTAFMLGLGLGGLFGGWLADLPRVDHLRVFAGVEAAVCVYGVFSLELLAWAGRLTGPLGPGAVFIVTFVLVLVPTALMGSTLPLLVTHAARRSGNVGHSLGVLYFANTLGGAVAAVVTAVVLLRHLGLQASVFAAAAVNAVIAVLMLAVRRVSLPAEPP